MSANAAPPPSDSSASEDPGMFERWRRRFGAMTGVGLTEQERWSEMQTYQNETCEKWKRELMRQSPAIVFMLEHLQRNGCDVGPQNIVCEPCSTVRAGGFSPDAGAITICQERILHKQHMEDTMMHELVHMYDHVKFKVDWNNLRHHACSEIRANSLSGDCKFTHDATAERAVSSVWESCFNDTRPFDEIF